MIDVTLLIAELKKLPEGSKAVGYEGEAAGLRIQKPDGSWTFINTGWDDEDVPDEPELTPED